MNSNAPIRDSEVEIQALKNALAAHQSGQLADAEQRYRNILQQTPSATDALHYLGMVLHQQQRTSDEALLRAILSKWKKAVIYIRAIMLQR